MNINENFDGGLKYKPDYKWPKAGTKRKCPKCKELMQLLENKDNYYGKPWWCVPCQWQYSEEDLSSY